MTMPPKPSDSALDSLPLWAKLIYVYGVPSAIAMGLVWLLATQGLKSQEAVLRSQEVTRQEMHDHSFQTSFYMRSMCISLAELAGKSATQCDPNTSAYPPVDRR